MNARKLLLIPSLIALTLTLSPAEIDAERLRILLQSSDPSDRTAAQQMIRRDRIAAAALLPEIAASIPDHGIDKEFIELLRIASGNDLLKLLALEHPRKAPLMYIISERATLPTDAVKSIDSQKALAAVENFLSRSDSPKDWTDGIVYWSNIRGTRGIVSKPMADLMLDRMLGNDTNLTPSLRTFRSPQDSVKGVIRSFDEDPSIEKRLSTALSHKGVDFRKGALLAYRWGGPVSATVEQLFLKRYKIEKDLEVRAALVLAMGNVSTHAEPTVVALLSELEKEDAPAGNIARSLGYLAEKVPDKLRSEIVTSLFRTQSSDRGEPTRFALLSLRSIILQLPIERQKALVNKMLPMAKTASKYQDYRLRVIAAAGPAATEAVPLLEERLQQAEPGEKAMYARLYWAVTRDSKRVLPIFAAAIHSDDSTERNDGIRGLSGLGEDASSLLPEFVKKLRSNDRQVRLTGLKCLAGLGSSAASAADEIRPFLKSGRESERKYAARAIATIDAVNK